MTRRIDLLRAIGLGDVTWRRHGSGRSYRLWVDEEHFSTVTRWVRDLIADGEVKGEAAAGYSLGGAPCGSVVLTRGGARRLGCTCDGPDMAEAWGHMAVCPLAKDGQSS